MTEAAGPRFNFAILGTRGYPSTYGGFETFVRHFAPALQHAGHDVTVYCRQREGPHRVWERDGVRCVQTPGVQSKSLSTLTHGATSALDASLRSFDAVLVMNVANGFFLPVLRAAGVPVALNVDGLEWERGKWGPLARTTFRGGAWASARWADRLVVDSRAVGRWWHDEYGVESTYIPYGGQLVDALPSDRVVELGLRPGAYVLVVARLLPENNIDLVLDAVSDLGPGVELVVVGTAGYASPLEGRLAAEHDRGTLRWLRHVADQTLLTQLWRHCGIYVHGHSVGGTNPALLQALGAGAPTLALDTPFNREVVEHLDQLFPHDRAELARRIGALLGDPERRRELAARGRRIVASRYSWDTVCDRYTGLLVELATVAQSARSGMAWRRMRKARSSIAAPAAHSAIDPAA